MSVSSSSDSSGDPSTGSYDVAPASVNALQAKPFSTLNSLGLRSSRDKREDDNTPLSNLLRRQGQEQIHAKRNSLDMQREGSRSSAAGDRLSLDSPSERESYKQRFIANMNAHLNSSPPISPAKESPSRLLDAPQLARNASSSSSSRTLNGTMRRSPRPLLRAITPVDDQEEDELESRRPFTEGVDSIAQNYSSIISMEDADTKKRRDSYDGASTSASASTLRRHSPSLASERTLSSIEPKLEDRLARAPSVASIRTGERTESAAAERRRIRESLMQSTWTTPANGSQTISASTYKRSPANNSKSSGDSGTFDSGSSGNKSRPGLPAEFRNATLQSPYLSPSMSKDGLKDSGSSGRASSTTAVSLESPIPPPSASSRSSGGSGRSTRHADRRQSASTELETPIQPSLLRARKRSLLSERSSTPSANQSIDSRDEIFSQGLNGLYRHRGSTSPPSSNASFRNRNFKPKVSDNAGSDSWWNEVQELRQRIGALEMNRPVSRADSLHSQEGEEEEINSRTPISSTVNHSMPVRSATSMEFQSDLPPSRIRPRRTSGGRSRTSLGMTSLPSSPSGTSFEQLTSRKPLAVMSPDHLKPARTDLNRLLLDAMSSFERQLLSTIPTETAASVDLTTKLASLTELTSQINLNIRTIISQVIESQVAVEIDDNDHSDAQQFHLQRTERNLAKLLKESDEQVRRFTEMLLACSRFDKERHTLASAGITPPRARVPSVRERLESRQENRPPTSAGIHREDTYKADLARSKTVGYGTSRVRRSQTASLNLPVDEDDRLGGRRAKESSTSQATVRPSALTHFPRSSMPADLSTEQAVTQLSPTQNGLYFRKPKSMSYDPSEVAAAEDDNTARFSLSSDDSASTPARRRFSFSSTSAAAALRLGLSSLASSKISGRTSKQNQEDFA